MKQFFNIFGMVSFVAILQGVLIIQSAKAFLSNNLLFSPGNMYGNENPIDDDMLRLLIRYLNEQEGLAGENSTDPKNKHPMLKYYDNDDKEDGNNEQGMEEMSEINRSLQSQSNPLELEKRLFTNQNTRDLNKLFSYRWGSNPTFWRPTFQLAPSEYPKDSSKQSYFRPSQSSYRSGWESNPAFWGKRDYWMPRGKKLNKNIGSTSRSLEMSLDNSPSFWKSRGKREESKTFNTEIRGPIKLVNPEAPWPDKDVLLEPNYWTNRGKKSTRVDDSTMISHPNLKRELVEKYWTSRGRRRMENRMKSDISEDGSIPYWVPRGKKNIEMTNEF